MPTDPHVDRKPNILRKIQLSASTAPAATPVAMGRGPAPPATPQPQPHQAQPSGATICLDSDDEDRPPAVAPVPPRRRLTKIGTGPAPVPVALTGPNAQTIPLAPAPQITPTYYQLSPCGMRAIPVQAPPSIPQPMPSSSGPVPVTLLGPASQPTPVSKAIPIRGIPMPGYFTDSNPQPGRAAPPVPISLVSSQPVPISLVGPDAQPVKLQPAPIPMSLVDASGRPVGLAGMPMFVNSQSMVFSSHQPTPTAPSPTAVRAPMQQQPSMVKPGDLLRITQSGLVKILERKRESLNKLTADLPTTIIDDEEPAPVAPRALPKIAPKPAPTKAAPKPPEPPKVPTPPPPTPAENPAKRKSRRSWSSSSSSSGRSRSSSSEDPLAILKDVVHIQAPDKPAQREKKKVDPTPKSSNIGSYKIKQGNQKTESLRSDAKKDKNTVDLTNVSSFAGPGNTKITSSKKPADTSKPSTSRSNDVQKDASKSNTIKLDVSKLSKNLSTSMTTNSSKASSSKPKPSTSKSVPFKLVGTSKSIILDGKSKTLKVEPKSRFVNL